MRHFGDNTWFLVVNEVMQMESFELGNEVAAIFVLFSSNLNPSRFFLLYFVSGYLIGLVFTWRLILQ